VLLKSRCDEVEPYDSRRWGKKQQVLIIVAKSRLAGPAPEGAGRPATGRATAGLPHSRRFASRHRHR
jgi:hypothetical protein